MDKPKIVIITGQTATGKTELATRIARKINGEIISADSRQVYVGLDIISGKDVEGAQKSFTQVENPLVKNSRLITYSFDKIPVWLYDVVNVDYQFNVSDYQKVAGLIISDILKRGKVPVVVGGTGLYVRSIVKDLKNIYSTIDQNLRNELSFKSVLELQKILENDDKEILNNLNNSDKNNPRRLIRAIEKSRFSQKNDISESAYDYLTLVLFSSKDKLDLIIRERVLKRLKQGAINEFVKLSKQFPNFSNYSSYTSTGCLEIEELISGKISEKELIEKWSRKEIKYAKRQLTWFKKYHKVPKQDFWIDASNLQTTIKIENDINEFLQSQL